MILLLSHRACISTNISNSTYPTITLHSTTQASLFLFGQAMPFAVLLTMLILWVVPMTLAAQRSLFVLAEVLNAWSTLDVFCIAIAAALLEIQQFAAFIVGDSCDGINVILAEYFDTQLEGDDKCFDVVAQLDEVSVCVCSVCVV